MRQNLPLSLILLGAILFTAPHAHAQLLTDTLFTWSGYRQAGSCGLHIYAAAPRLDRSHVILLREIAENRGPSVVDDLGYLAEEIGRAYHLAPDSVLWIIQWGAFSFPGADQHPKTLFLRATLKRTTQGRLGSPQWRIVTRQEIVEYTDRAFH